MKYFYAIIYLNKIMDLTDINQKKEENYMDIQSPYIKNDSNSIDEVRKRITKRATTGNLIETEGKVLSFKNKEDMPESDDVLKQKVSNTKKKYWDSPESNDMREHLSIKSKENGSKPPSRAGKIPWNKGLTKDTDPRVQANAVAISKPKSNTEKMGKYDRSNPNYNIKNGKR